MAKKKIFMSVTASAAIASAFVAADKVDAASHKVQSGDSLWSIAQKHNTSVANLKSLNKLSSDIIFPNQTIKIGEGKPSSSGSSTSGSSSSNSGGSSSGSGSTYTVKAGDTLSAIASKHGISLTNLMKWNGLDTTLIFPGNKLSVSKSGGSSGGSSSSSGSNSNSSGNSGSSSGGSSGSTYVVKSGDTLSHIASRHGVSVSNLKSWNNLSSDLIRIGQKLSINGKSSGGSSSSSPNSNNSSSNSGSSGGNASANTSFNVNTLISNAKSVLGTKYVWGGQTKAGFDCSGFIHYAYNEAGMSMGRTSTDGYYNRSYEISNPQVGDLVFFSGTYRAGISHMGIYLGNNEFIHAGTSTGVTITNLNNSYWSKHFHSFKRFY